MRRAALAVTALLLPTLLWGQPRRVVSLNLCTDQLVMALAQPEHIASVTWLSRSEGDPALRPLARRLPANHGGAEEVLAARPDLVIAGLYTTSTTRRLLQRAGIPLLEVEPAQLASEPVTVHHVECRVRRPGRSRVGRQVQLDEAPAPVRPTRRTSRR